MPKIMVVFSRDEIQQRLPYEMICITRYGSSWEIGKRKLRWTKEFTELERDSARSIFRKSYLWYLVKGVPNEVSITTETLNLWDKVANFCASL